MADEAVEVQSGRIPIPVSQIPARAVAPQCSNVNVAIAQRDVNFRQKHVLSFIVMSLPAQYPSLTSANEDFGSGDYYMRLAIFSLAAALVVVSPAVANEARVEARGGIVWANGDSEAIAGVAVGYDYDMSGGMFVGAEASADKILVDGSDIAWGGTARVGTKIGEQGKVFVAGGYTFGEGEDAPHLGAGYEHKFGKSVYGKVEYRHFFVGNGFVDLNTAVVGLGIKF